MRLFEDQGMTSRAFTLKANQLLWRIKLELYLSTVQEDADMGLAKKYIGLVDTSSRHTRISRKVTQQLGLQAISTNEAGVSLYRIDVYLPNNIRITSVPVIRSESFVEEEIDCALGMDVLSCGDLSLSHRAGQTMFSFRVPTLGAPDFVEEHQKALKHDQNQEAQQDSKQGRPQKPAKISTTSATRDQPCPCGSGKKYKNCCGKVH